MERPDTSIRWCHTHQSSGECVDSDDYCEHAYELSRVDECQMEQLVLTRPERVAELLAGISELATRYDVQANTVAVWTQRHDSFPEPLIQVGGRVRVWWVPDVDEWLEKR